MFQCPTCKSSEDLEISCAIRTEVSVNKDGDVIGSRDDGSGFEWENGTPAHCGECDWSGTVAEMTIDDEAETPIILTRDAAIEELTDMRLEERDDEDLRDWLIEGRIGFKEMCNEELAELYANFTNRAPEDVIVTGQEPEPTIELKRADFDELLTALRDMRDMAAYNCPYDFDDEEHKRNVLGSIDAAADVLTKHTPKAGGRKP